MYESLDDARMEQEMDRMNPLIEAEIAYRRERIARDFAVARGWELSLRSLFGRSRQPSERTEAPQPRHLRPRAL